MISSSFTNVSEMPEYNESDQQKKRKPCAGVKEDLINCLMSTDCVQKEKKSAKECLLSHHPSVPQECHALRTLFFECKRSLLDNRQRFRGRKGY